MKINFPKEDEAGFTLVELTIATGLTLIVLVIAGGILISGLRTQEVARTVTDAANTAQQIVHSVQTGVKNASAITVTSNATTGTQLLLVRTVSSDPNSTAPSCQAWYGGAVYTTKTTPAVAITLPTGGPQGIWTILGTGVSPADPTTGKVFNAPNGGRVELKFDVAAGVHPYVLVNTMTYNSQSTTVSSPCF
jgi:type II secretory pathway pseudopilin PulG